MNLKEYIQTMKGNRIRVGTKKGSGFIYAGQADDIDLQALDEKIQSYMITKAAGKGVKEKLLAYVPIGNREVTDSYSSIRNPETTIVIIDGTEAEQSVGGVELEQIPGYNGCCDDKAAERVVAAIYSQVVDDMDSAISSASCLMPWYDLNGDIGALEEALKSVARPGKGRQIANLRQVRLILAEIKAWIDEGVDEIDSLDRWMMRETDPGINGHISNPRKVIQQVRDNNRATRIEKHYKSFLDYTSKKDNS